MLKHWTYSFGCWRPFPSAMFDGTDTAARRIWLVKPKTSVRGRSLVTL
ncbi:MAG: hypothetical protein M9921_02410 [Fimbriimonadaceae bacterium]|nr:hypothetical protein [Fimbriimonadaceae bacterium]